MQDITTGTEKQIAYAIALREKTVAQYQAVNANRNESYYQRRLAAFKAERLAECSDAGTIIDWCKGYANIAGQGIMPPYKEEEIRQQALADRKAFEEANPKPVSPKLLLIGLGHRRGRRQLTPEQQQAKEKSNAEWAAYNVIYSKWEDELEAYMLRVEAERRTVA